MNAKTLPGSYTLFTGRSFMAVWMPAPKKLLGELFGNMWEINRKDAYAFYGWIIFAQIYCLHLSTGRYECWLFILVVVYCQTCVIAYVPFWYADSDSSVYMHPGKIHLDCVVIVFLPFWRDFQSDFSSLPSHKQ